MKSTKEKRKFMSKPIQLTLTEAVLSSLAKKEKIPLKLKKQIIAEAKDTANHFNGYNWELDYDYILGDLAIRLLGFNPEWLFLESLLKLSGKKFYLHHPLNSKTLISTKSKPKSPGTIGTFSVGTKSKKKTTRKAVRK